MGALPHELGAASPDAFAHPLNVVVHPAGGDAADVRGALERCGAPVVPSEGPAALDALFRSGDAVLVCSQEGLSEETLTALEAVCEAQARWACLPVVLLIDEDADIGALGDRLAAIEPRTLLTILHRPLRPLEFQSAVRTALVARDLQLDVRDQIAREVELNHEIDHRMKNQLSTFMAVYRMSRRQSRSLEELDRLFGQRLGALRRVTQNLRAAPADRLTMQELCESAFAPFNAAGDVRLHYEGPEIVLGRTPSITLSLVFNELTTNAVKFGALSRESGTVALTWLREGEDVVIRWRETGGPPIRPPDAESFGTRFVRQSAVGLGGVGRLDFRADGLTVELRLPAAGLEAA